MKKTIKKESIVKRVSLLAAGLLLVAGVVSASEGNLLDRVVQKAGELVAGFVIGQGGSSAGSSGEEVLGAFTASPTNFTDLRVTNDLFVEELVAYRGRSATTTDAIQRWYEESNVGTASSTFLSLQQTRSGYVYARLAALQLDGNASTTMRFSIGTSTVALAPDYDAAVGSIARGLLDRCSVPTSTVNALVLGCGNTGVLNSTTSTPWIAVPLNSYVVGYMTTGGSDAIQGSSATSVPGRGFLTSSKVILEFMRIATSTYDLLQ